VTVAAGAALFTPEWFAAAAALAAAAEVPIQAATLGVEYRVVLPGGEVTHHQRFAGGRLVAWERGTLPDGDLRLRQTLPAHLALLTRRGVGNAVLRESAVELQLPGEPAGTVRRLPPPPLDEVLVDWGGSLPEVRTVPTITVQQVLVGSPFGTVSTWFRLERARVVESGVGRVDADVIATRRYADGLAERDGALDVLESIVRGEIGGDIKLLSMFLGIYDDEPCRRARRALSTPALRPLARLGEVLSSPGWATVGEGLAATLPNRRDGPQARTQDEPDV